MKAVILAGGLGSRLSEETISKPKPMIEIGGIPILVHIMNIYSNFGIDEFIICMGYKKEVIIDYFINYSSRTSQVLDINLATGIIVKESAKNKNWKIKLVDTGENTMVGGRIKRILPFVEGENYFHLTYGDGLADVNLNDLVKEHLVNNKRVTLTAVQPEGRFGSLDISNNEVKNFIEKPIGDGGWINGGFFVVNPNGIKEIISGDETIWEDKPLKQLAKQGELGCYKHSGFWKPMDTLRDKIQLEELWSSNNAPWVFKK